MASAAVVAGAGSHAALLTTVRLRLSPSLVTRALEGERLVVKNQAARRYLILTPALWRILQDFEDGAIVPDVLLQAITEGRCPPLREFYELILKACHDGFLLGDGVTAPAAEQPIPWRIAIRGPVVRLGALVVIAMGIVLAASPKLTVPESLWELAAAWLLLCASISVGNLIAASVVRGAGGEIYRPRFAWRTRVPHFAVTLSDEIMGGRPVAIDSALVRIAAPLALAGAVAHWAPQLLLPLISGQLLYFSPLWRSPLLDLLQALYRDPELATTYSFLFVQNRLLTLLRNARGRFADRKYLVAQALATVVWLVGVFLFSAMLLHANAAEILQRFEKAGGWHWAGLVLLILLGGLLLGSLLLAFWIGGRQAYVWFKERSAKSLQSRAVAVAPDSIRDLLQHVSIFEQLPAAERTQLATALQPEEFPAGAYVMREGELGDKLFIVFSGRLRVSQKLDAVHRTDAFGEFGAGDVLGERALLGDGHRTATVRCVTQSVLLSLNKADFTTLVLSRVARAAIEDKVQKAGFLQRIALSRHWSQPTVARFARRARFEDIPQDALIARQGAEFPYFCLIHEGEFAIEKDGKRVGRLRRGDYYGELSMLWHNTARANIVALTPGRCLLVPVDDFLEFITRDVEVVLQFERIGSDRLGRPVFGHAARAPASVGWSSS